MGDEAPTQTIEEYVKDKVESWQEGQSIGLGAREKGTCIAYLFNKLNDLSKQVEELKNGK